MEELITTAELKKLRRKKKVEELKQKAVTQAKRVGDLVSENKEFLTVAIPAAAMLTKQASSMAKTVLHGHNLKRDERMKQSRWYDPSLGHYWYAKRPLTTDEQLVVKRRRKAGENLGDILESMKLLK